MNVFFKIKHPPSLSKILFTTSLITAISTSPLLAAECEISGLNMSYAYSRTASNGAEFKCVSYRESTRSFDGYGNFHFLPLPTELQCLHKKARFISGYKDYRMLAFNKPGTWPLNGWKISRYKMVGAGEKIRTRSGGIVFQGNKSLSSKWSFRLQKIWLKKKNGTCSNIHRVIEQAFGD